MSESPDVDAPEVFGDVITINLPVPVDGPGGPVSQLVLTEPTAGQLLLWTSSTGRKPTSWRCPS